MSRLLSRSSLRCPACGYDVEQTLRDRIDVCPECGGRITEDTCRVESRVLPARWLRWLVPASLSPMISLAVAVGLDVAGFEAPLGPLLLACAAVIGAAWWAVERRLEPHAPLWLVTVRAAAWIVTLFVVNGVLAAVLAGGLVVITGG